MNTQVKEETTSDRRKYFFEGVKDISPILMGVVPFATIAGIAAVNAGLSKAMAMTLSLTVFAGASQLAAMQLVGAGAASFVVIYTALVVNMRFVVYSASIAPHFKSLSNPLKMLYAYMLTDQGYAVSVLRLRDCEHRDRHWYYLGASVPIWLTWQVFSAVGIFVGSHVPEHWELEFAVPLTFLAVLVQACENKKATAAAVSAGLIAVTAQPLPLNLGLILGVMGGILAGYGVDSFSSAEDDDS